MCLPYKIKKNKHKVSAASNIKIVKKKTSSHGVVPRWDSVTKVICSFHPSSGIYVC